MQELRLAKRWAQELEAVAARIGQFVPRPETRARTGRFLRVTVAGGARRNGWLLAPLVAQMVTAYVTGRDAGRHAPQFDPGRFGA